MEKDHKVSLPSISKDYLCIINTDDKLLSAVISSYICDKGIYTPIFEFPRVTVANQETDAADFDEHSFSSNRARRFNIKIRNVLGRNGNPKYVILGGLSHEQKSYFNFADDVTILHIEDVYDAANILGPISGKYDDLACTNDNVMSGLYLALQLGKALRIDNNAEPIAYENIAGGGMVIIEDINQVSSILAINYAAAIDAAATIIAKPKVNVREIKDMIERWQDGDGNAFNDLSATLYDPISELNFSLYDYATFFTIGAPYSLILKNLIPFSHVHLHLNPDFFIFNSLYFENSEKTNSALVFSPLEFKDEETEGLIKLLKFRDYYVKELVGKEASVYQISNHVKEFPFDLLHICSHGGEASGFTVKKTFEDRYGETHVVEFDEVVSFAPSHNEELIPVTVKILPRRFNGHLWGSRELKEMDYPHYIFVDMYKAIENIEKHERTKKNPVPNSCAIKCADFYYQAVFDGIAALRSPFIFNNTCWSWIDIADSFLASGSRVYIGTLWKVDNIIAKTVAEAFYGKAFDDTIINALFRSLDSTKGNKNEDIYMVWGLHFSTLSPEKSITEPRLLLASRMLDSLQTWKRQEKTAPPDSKEAIQSLIVWTANELAYNYRDEVLKMISWP